MKRFAVLCSIAALFSLYALSWATAPSVSDLPDVRLIAGSAPPSGVLSVQEMDAYNLVDYIKDFDQAIGALSITIPSVQMANTPPDILTPNAVTPVPTIQKDGSHNVDIYGRTDPGWAIYTVQVDDTTPAHLAQENAFAKYSTFAMGTPSLSAGRFFDLSSTGWQLAYVWIGEDLVVEDLDSTLDPPATSVTWEAYFNNLVMATDANDDIVGIDPQYVQHGTSFSTSGGWNVAISSTGGLTLSPGGSFSPGPFLVGILATKAADDQDGTRVLVSAGLLGAASADLGETITPGLSETLDDLSTGDITTPPAGAWPGSGMPPAIQTGSHWMYWLQGDDFDLTPAQLTVVDLSTDSLLPTPARPGNFKGVIGAGAASTIAGGNAIRATLVGSSTGRSGFRLMSRALTNAQPGEVYTFAVNVATDITDATHSPNYNMAMTSQFGAMISGTYMEQFGLGAPAAGSVLEDYHKDVVPWAADGWQTLSVNFTPPLTYFWLDANADNTMDSADLALISAFLASRETGAGDPIEMIRASLKIWTRDGTGFSGLNLPMTDTFHIWMDNLRIYKSAYELDLGYQVTEYVVPQSTAGIMPALWTDPQPSGNIDGSFEGYTNTGNIQTDLDAIGFAVGDGTAAREPWFLGGWYSDAGTGAVSVNTSIDHTKSGGSSNCLQIALPSGGEPAGANYRSFVPSAIVGPAGSGQSGIYGIEMYVSKARSTNNVIGDRTPMSKLSLQTIAPISLGPNYNAVLVNGGLPDSVGAEDNNWLRLVFTAYINEAQLFRAAIVMQEPLPDGFTQSSDQFDVPVYFDDIRVYSVDDPAKFFDADLFDSI